MKKILVVCTTDSMIWNFLIPHIQEWTKENYHVDCACSKTGFYFNELIQKYYMNLYNIPFQRFPFKIVNIWCIFKLYKLIKSKKYSLIVCQEPVGGAIGRIASIFTKSKVVYMAHGFHFYKGASVKNWIIYYPIERILAHFTNVLITTNKEDYLRSLSFKTPQKYMIKGIGIDLSKYNNDFTIKNIKKQELKIPIDSKVILTAGELIERKNISTCIKALANISIKNCYLVICGDGPLKNDLENLCKKLCIQDRVIFLGFRKDLHEIYKIADVFLFPSFQEGLSVALLGAMASGLPVVCSRIRGNVDLIQENLGGYLCKTTDVKSYVKYLKKILEDTSNVMGIYNHHIVQEYSLEKSVKFISGIINQTLNH